jgi:hypothetical protein
MAQPIYFLPGLHVTDADDRPKRSGILSARGLAEIFAGVPLDLQPCYELSGNGPGGLAGCMLCYQTPDGRMPRAWGNKLIDSLPWSPIGDGSLLWLAIDPADPPRPDELVRSRRCRGYDAELGDGQKWHVPVIRRPDGSSFLPSAFSRDTAGRRIEKLRAEFQSHFEALRPAAEWLYGDMDPQKLDRDAFIDLAIRALGINYRFGWNEQEQLGLVGTENYLLILAAAVDVPAFKATTEAQKKSSGHQSETSISPGPPAASPVTSPVSAISGS